MRTGNRAIRIQRAREPLLLTFCSTEEAEIPNTDSNGDALDLAKGKTSEKTDRWPHMMMDRELYEGIVSQPIIEPSVSRVFVGVALRQSNASRVPERRRDFSCYS